MGGSAERQGCIQGCLRRADSERDRGAAWARVDVVDGGTELAVFPVRGDDGAVSGDNNN